MRLIDADALKEKINTTFWSEIGAIIDNAPTIDAVHGEWVRKYDDKINCYGYECDQCGEYRPRNQFGKEYNANFCPNCGAIMRKGDEEE